MLGQMNETNVQHGASMDNGSYQYSVVDELAALLEAWPGWGSGWSIKERFFCLGIIHNCQHLLINSRGY